MALDTYQHDFPFLATRLCNRTAKERIVIIQQACYSSLLHNANLGILLDKQIVGPVQSATLHITYTYQLYLIQTKQKV